MLLAFGLQDEPRLLGLGGRDDLGLQFATTLLVCWRELLGVQAYGALRSALESGRMPADELADGALILIGGTLMLSPGFVLDVLGVLLILPFTRPLFRGVLAKVVSRRLTVFGPMGAGHATRPGPGSEGPVIRGEVVDD